MCAACSSMITGVLKWRNIFLKCIHFFELCIGKNCTTVLLVLQTICKITGPVPVLVYSTISTTTTTILWPPGLCPGLPDEPVPER